MSSAATACRRKPRDSLPSRELNGGRKNLSKGVEMEEGLGCIHIKEKKGVNASGGHEGNFLHEL